MAVRPKCPKCGNDCTMHTKTKAGNQRYQCKPCGIKPFVPVELKKQNENPPCKNSNCMYLGSNKKVHKNGNNKKGMQTRYVCTECGVSFMKDGDYKPKRVSEYARINIVNLWLSIKDNKDWYVDISNAEEKKSLTINQYLCKRFNISVKTLNKIINEYKDAHPELCKTLEQMKEHSRKLIDTYERRNKSNAMMSEMLKSRTSVSITGTEDE